MMTEFAEKLLNTMAEMSETGVNGEFPGIRNLRKVEVTEEQRISPSGYSFEFEAFVEGEWREYGPNCYGNWTCLRGVDGLPDSDTEHWNQCFPENPRPNFRTIGIGWYSLRRLYDALVTAREREVELPEEYNNVLAKHQLGERVTWK
jgi:hypothetical protein